MTVTKWAGESEIIQPGTSAMFKADDMIDLKFEK